jgi:hypothetical protein
VLLGHVGEQGHHQRVGGAHAAQALGQPHHALPVVAVARQEGDVRLLGRHGFRRLLLLFCVVRLCVCGCLFGVGGRWMEKWRRGRPCSFIGSGRWGRSGAWYRRRTRGGAADRSDGWSQRDGSAGRPPRRSEYQIPSIVHILFPCIRGFNLIIPNESLLTFLFIMVL